MCATYDWRYDRDLSADEVNRRASVRRKYNALRRDQADIRRARMMQYIDALGDDAYFHGIQSHLAERFGVHRSTITRDLQRLAEENWAGQPARCPLCSSCVPAGRLRPKLDALLACDEFEEGELDDLDEITS